MKWKDLYNAVSIAHPMEQSDVAVEDYFERMVEGIAFSFQALHIEVEHNREKLFYYPEHFSVLISRVEVLKSPEGHSLQITCTLVDILPPGFQSGTFTLIFEGDQFCRSLPESMFLDEEISTREFKRILKSWEMEILPIY